MLVLRVRDTHDIGNVPRMPAVPGVSSVRDRVRSGLAPANKSFDTDAGTQLEHISARGEVE
jgi:hypothetical protein